MKTDNSKVEKINMQISLWMWTVLCVGFMVVMLVFAADKKIVIAEVSQDQTGLGGDAAYKGHGEQDVALMLQRTYTMEGSFCIPLSQEIKPENVSMENRYYNRSLWIYIQGGSKDFYKDNVVFGDVSHVLEGCCEPWEDGAILKLEMDGVMEYRSTLEGSTLTIAYSKPHDTYDFVVILDPAGGGNAPGAEGSSLKEKDLTLEIARSVQRQFELQNVRFYLTRVEDVDVEPQDRAELADAVDADLYIRISAWADEEHPESYGIWGSYNDVYFIPEYGNVELADTVTKAVTIAASNRAAGLLPADRDSVLRSIKTVAMELAVGNLANPEEEALLKQEFYREKLATGILNAVQEACEALGQMREEDK